MDERGKRSQFRETNFSQARTGTGKNNVSCSADLEQDWQPYPVDAQPAKSDTSPRPEAEDASNYGTVHIHGVCLHSSFHSGF